MAVWLLEYRISHPSDVVGFDAFWPVHDAGNRWLSENLGFPPGSAVTVGYQSEARAAGASDPRSSCTWLGYYLLYVPADRDGAALAGQLGDVVRRECDRAGWQWEAEVRAPSDEELRPLRERYPKAERWALVELFASVYRPPWERAEPGAAPAMAPQKRRRRT
jgi:hypothetical protein